MVNISQIWLVPAFPLLGFVLNGLLGKRFGTRFVSIVGPLAIGLAFAQSLVLFFQMLNTDGKILAGLLSLGIFVQIAFLFTGNELKLGHKGEYPIEVVEEIGSIALIGRLLFTDYILSFEIIVILLLVAVIGAGVIAKRKFH